MLIILLPLCVRMAVEVVKKVILLILSKILYLNLSEALLRTRLLAENFAKRAELEIPEITQDPVHQKNLISLTKLVTNRDK